MWRSYLPVCLWWAVILFLAVLLKYHYSTASAAELQWMLRPLASMVQLTTGLQFDDDGSGVWLEAQNDIAIVKSCAGINFMILSLFVYARRWQPCTGLPRGPCRLPVRLAAIVLCLAAAWSAALLVNTMRIVVAVHLYQQELSFANLSPEQMHRAAGVIIYLPALWLQFYLFSRVRRERAGLAAAVLYLGMMIFVPLLNGSYQSDPVLFIEHARVTIGLTLLLLVMQARISHRLPSRGRRGAGVVGCTD